MSSTPSHLAARGLAGLPAPLLVVGAACSVQSGAAVATALFQEVGPLGAVWFRTAFATLLLIGLAPRLIRRRFVGPLRWVVALGVALAAMNSLFYEAIDRVPLGVAVTVEFTGPLAVAVAGSRRPRDFLWVALGAAGIALLGSPTVDVDRVGLLLALGAGSCWAAYIVFGKRVAAGWPLAEGVALPMAIAALLTTPLGIASGASHLDSPEIVGLGLAVAVLSSILPNLLGLAALRRVRISTFGIFMSLEPAVAALAGALFLSQGLSAAEAAAVACVVVASAGANSEAAPDAPPPAEP
jgi:inner membrane transporter RhtA